MKNGYHVRWIPMFSVASGHFTWKSELFMVKLYRKSIPVLMFTFPLSLVMALHLDKLKSESFQVVLCKPEWLLAKTFSCNLSLVAIPKQIEIDMFPGRYRWYSPHNCRMVPPSDVCWFITPMNIIVISPIIYFNWTLSNGAPSCAGFQMFYRFWGCSKSIQFICTALIN